MKSRANSSCKSSMWIFDAPVLRAFASSPRNSSSCPMLAQKAIISALYFSLIHERSTEVSNPPEYAKTIFIWVANLPVWCLRNTYTFVALKLAWGEARGRECIPSDTRPTEQRSPRPISAQPGGQHVFWAEALLLAPHRSTLGYAHRSRLASAQNPLPRMYSYFGDTTLVPQARFWSVSLKQFLRA